ncbi:MAG: DNA polymerase III subunit epsilon [Pseudomonadales bacterium]|nr:DNA polymerase III subunit epsilon [Pseudomonadales bacterium]
MRQIVLDTETTGLEPQEGHRIIEIGCVEMINRRLTGKNYHVYINPDRIVDDGAIEVHGITNEFLEDKPRFGEIADQFMEFVKGAELVIHNAPFDVGFIDHELKLLNSNWTKTADYCQVLDTLVLARKMHPGQRNTLDALCKRYEIDNSHRELHGALLDSEILADVYLMMTGGQTALTLGGDDEGGELSGAKIVRLDQNRPSLRVITASESEMVAHEERLAGLDKSSGEALWRKLGVGETSDPS